MEASEAVTKKSIHDKVTGYLFNPENSRGWAKGEWFRRALGLEAENEEHMVMLESQIKYNPETAQFSRATQYGEMFDQDVTLLDRTVFGYFA